MLNNTASLIKKLRLSRGFSQDQVAKSIGISRPTYNAIETGKQKLDIEELVKLSSLFSVGVDELMSGSLYNIPKYKQMIISLLRMNLSKDGKITKTKLAKLLYLSDFAWFYSNMESMSGIQYRKIAYGPVPDAFFRVIDELEESGKIIVDRKSSGGKDMLLISESDSNKNEKIDTLSKDEEKLMKDIVKNWKDKKTSEIVNFTHNQLPYKLCRDNELIPYELITQEDPDKVY